MNGTWSSTRRVYFGSSLFFLAILLPFPYYCLPETSEFICSALDPFLKAVGITLIGTIDSHWRLYSDSPGLLLLTVLIVLSSMVGVFLSMKREANLQRWMQLIEHLLLIFLALHLAQYGMAKLVGSQFPTPSLNILFTPFGQLEKDIAFWSLMGVAPLFVKVTGMIEVLCAALLLSKRTRFLGLTLSVLTMGHVVLLNFAFDIDVKVFAILLFLISLYLSTSTIGVWKVLIKAYLESISSEKSPSKSKLFGTIALSLVLVEVLSCVSDAKNTQSPTSRIYGAYEFNEPIETQHDGEIIRFIIHEEGFLIRQDILGNLSGQLAAIDTVSMMVVSSATGSAFSISESGKGHRLSGRFLGYELTEEVHKINLKDVPLLR